ncbi:hypothetical protein OUZ56_027780 [Daphnia magna]|uniref:Uncharacterized protein n=1 Tax=Daphnia magna TaxID=35525 RepID=A0ABR0B1W9_9CRUS|nr:hypothetical protein OUZ56_027780 [Daphnia magna]
MAHSGTNKNLLDAARQMIHREEGPCNGVSLHSIRVCIMSGQHPTFEASILLCFSGRLVRDFPAISTSTRRQNRIFNRRFRRFINVIAPPKSHVSKRSRLRDKFRSRSVSLRSVCAVRLRNVLEPYVACKKTGPARGIAMQTAEITRLNFPYRGNGSNGKFSAGCESSPSGGVTSWKPLRILTNVVTANRRKTWNMERETPHNRSNCNRREEWVDRRLGEAALHSGNAGRALKEARA